MVTGRAADRRRRRLLAPGERWGWEYRLTAADPTGPAPPHPGTDEPVAGTGIGVPEPDWTVPAADRYVRAVRHRRRHWWIAAGTALPATVALLLDTAGPRPAGTPAAALLVPAALLALVALSAAALAVLLPLRAVRAADRAYRDWLAACRPPHPGTGHPDRADPGGGTYLGRSGRGLGGGTYLGRWRPVRPVVAERVDVYGGTDRGWATLLCTVAGSVLGSGGSVTVLDLTGHSVGGELVRVTGTAGHRLDLLSLPDHLSAVGLLADLTPAQVGTVLAEAVHAVGPDPGTGDRAHDAGLVERAVALCRHADTVPDSRTAGSGRPRPLTFRRLAGALRALEATGEQDGAGHTRPTGVPRRADDATAGPRLRRLAAAVGRLALLEEHDPGVRPYRDPHAQLRVMQLLGGDPDPSTRLLAQILAGVLIHQVRRQDVRRSSPATEPPTPVRSQTTGGTATRAVEPPDAGSSGSGTGPGQPAPSRLLVVAGADGLRRTQVRRLAVLTRRRGIRLVLFHHRLPPDSAAPTGRHATILMRQHDAAGAELAATLTGADHQVLVADRTAAHRSPPRGSAPDAGPAGRLADPAPLPPAPPHPCRPSTGPTHHPGTRYAPTPGFLRELSETAYLLLDPHDPGSPRLLDCDPDLPP